MSAWLRGGKDEPVLEELPVTVRRNAQPFPVVWGSGNDHGVDRGGERRAKGNGSGSWYTTRDLLMKHGCT
jgi:hypothetical protein